MKLAFGLEQAKCSMSDLARAKMLIPPPLVPHLEGMGGFFYCSFSHIYSYFSFSHTCTRTLAFLIHIHTLTFLIHMRTQAFLIHIRT